MASPGYTPEKINRKKHNNHSKCLIHYDTIQYSDNLIAIDEVRYAEIVSAKECRMKLGANHLHHEQVTRVPPGYKTGLFYHRECYQNFTKARSLLRKREPLKELCPKPNITHGEETGRPRRSHEIDSAGRFPDHCWFCKGKKAKRIRTGKKDKLEPVTVVKHPSVRTTLMKAAEKRNDQTLIRCISDVDLQQKGFKRHSSCYVEYTSICYDREATKKEDPNNKVRTAIMDTVIGERKCMTIDEILDAKGEDQKNNETRRNIKRWLERNFKNEVLFLSADNKTSQIVVSQEVWDEVTSGSRSLNNSVQSCDMSVLREAASILKKIILDYTKSADDLPWPPTIESLRDRLKSTPDSLTTFLRLLLSPSDTHHITTETVNRHADSFAQDLIFSLTKGTFLTLKHTCIGLGLHSMTGMKIPIVLLSRLGHSITYDSVMEIETGQAEAGHHFDLDKMALPIQPKDASSIAPLVLWFDNFDSFVDNNTGAGSIHNTPGVAFQEETSSTMRRPSISIPKSKKRSLSDDQEGPAYKVPKINPKTNPLPIVGAVSSKQPSPKNHLLTLWKIARYQFRNDQLFSRYSGFIIKCFQMLNQPKTIMTYLPPIEKPITDYGTLLEVLRRSERLSKEANMKYTHIVMDCGAAMKMFHVIWNNVERFAKVIIHLGDFHLMQAFFGVIGLYVKGSGFEDIVYQLGLCQPGSMNAMLKGKHYNQAWLIHEMFAEAIVRLFIEIHLPSPPQKLGLIDPDNIQDILQETEVIEFLNRYEEMMNQGLHGAFGSTAQYWLQYVRMMDIMQNLHQSIQTNSFEERLNAWKDMMPFFFFFGRTHYSRYGSQYIEEMDKIDLKYPGAKEEMMTIGVSVRRNSYGIGQAIDLAGEQSFMRHSKTAGGIKSFQTRQCTVLKWVRNRAYQAEFVEQLKEMCGIEKTTQHLRKCLRPTEIVKHNGIVEKIMKTMSQQFTNPFNTSFEKEKLYNLVSGRPVSENISTSLLSATNEGTELYDKFKERLKKDGKGNFFDTLSRKKPLTFENSILRLEVKGKNKTESVKVERDILGILLTESSKNGCPVDINSALCYPLSPVPPAFCTADGGRRKTTKSDLLAVLGDMAVDENDPIECKVYMEDLAAFVRSSVSQCTTIRDMSTLLYKSKPSSCSRFYVMEDSYQNDGIKAGERKSRGQGVRYVLNNPDMKIPHDINNFLAMGENKTNLFSLIKRGIVEQTTGDDVILFSSKGKMTEIRENSQTEREDLACQHIEADFMFALYSRMETDVLIRSRSGDVDIVASLVGHQDLPDSIYVDNGTGSGRKLLQPSLCELGVEERDAIIGFHSFSGNDYIASFFRKGKKTCWKVAKRNKNFIKFFSQLGTGDVTNELLASAQEYVCALYGKPKTKQVNEARSQIFWEKYKKKKQVTELCLLPPCEENLKYHLQRSNFVARLMRSTSLRTTIDDFVDHGWTENGEPIWTNNAMPSNIQEILSESETLAKDDSEEDDLLDSVDESENLPNEDDDQDVELVDYS